MTKKGAKNGAKAAKIANAILAKTGDEGKAIRIALFQVNHGLPKKQKK